MAAPKALNELERAAHEVTHLPTMSWCEHYVTGKSKDDPHRQQPLQQEDSVDMVQMDYGHFKTELAEDVAMPVLVGDHVATQSGLAILCQTKGKQDIQVLRQVEEWLQELGLMGLLRIRTDGEPAILVVAQQVAARRAGRSQLETIPVGYSSSLRAGERKVQAIRGQVRTLRSALEAMYHLQLPITRPVYG
jgi:hypothetical protein